MKKLLTIVLLLFGSMAFGQEIPQYIGTPQTALHIRGRLYVDSLLILPYADTATVTSPVTEGAFVYQKTDKRIYFFNGSYWQPISAGTNLAPFLKKSDSAIYVTIHALDSLGALIPDAIDTTFLSNRINKKLNISDTLNKWMPKGTNIPAQFNPSSEGIIGLSGTYPNIEFSATETDPIWNAEKQNYQTTTQADSKYLQSYSETDPDFNSSPSAGITNTDITNWNTDENTTYTAGNDISIVGNQINNTRPDQIVTITGSGGIDITGTYPNFNINGNAGTGSGSGRVFTDYGLTNKNDSTIMVDSTIIAAKSWITGNYYNKTQSDSRYLQSYTETDPVANAKTITINGNSQTIGDNPSFTIAELGNLYTTDGTLTGERTIHGGEYPLNIDHAEVNVTNGQFKTLHVWTALRNPDNYALFLSGGGDDYTDGITLGKYGGAAGNRSFLAGVNNNVFSVYRVKDLEITGDASDEVDTLFMIDNRSGKHDIVFPHLKNASGDSVLTTDENGVVRLKHITTTSGGSGTDSAIVAKWGLTKTINSNLIGLSADSSKVATLFALNDSLRNRLIIDTTLEAAHLYDIKGSSTIHVDNGENTVLNNDVSLSLASNLIAVDTSQSGASLHDIKQGYGTIITGGTNTVIGQDVTVKVDTTSANGVVSKSRLSNALANVGTGSGDMLKSVYDPANGGRQVAFSDQLFTNSDETDPNWEDDKIDYLKNRSTTNDWDSVLVSGRSQFVLGNNSNAPYTGYMHGLFISHGPNTDYGTELAFRDNRFYLRSIDGGVIQPWETIAYQDWVSDNYAALNDFNSITTDGNIQTSGTGKVMGQLNLHLKDGLVIVDTTTMNDSVSIGSEEVDPTVTDFTKALTSNTTILNAVKSVDGAGSGLNADLLDGENGSYYSKNIYTSDGSVDEDRNVTFNTGLVKFENIGGMRFTNRGVYSMYQTGEYDLYFFSSDETSPYTNFYNAGSSVYFSQADSLTKPETNRFFIREDGAIGLNPTIYPEESDWIVGVGSSGLITDATPLVKSLISDSIDSKTITINGVTKSLGANPSFTVSGGEGGSGTVTSVGLSLPSSIFSLSGSPVTSSGTLTGSFKSQTANTVFAAPSGSNGVPDFRDLVAADIPNLSTGKITSGIFSTARLGSGTASSSTYLRGDGTWASLPASSGEANVQSDWNESNTSSDAYIKNKPTLFSGSYSDLTNKPTIPTVNNATLTLNTSGIASGSTTFTANSSSNRTFTVNVPSTLSSYTNDAGFVKINDGASTSTSTYSSSKINSLIDQATDGEVNVDSIQHIYVSPSIKTAWSGKQAYLYVSEDGKHIYADTLPYIQRAFTNTHKAVNSSSSAVTYVNESSLQIVAQYKGTDSVSMHISNYGSADLTVRYSEINSDGEGNVVDLTNSNLHNFNFNNGWNVKSSAKSFATEWIMRVINDSDGELLFVFKVGLFVDNGKADLYYIRIF